MTPENAAGLRKHRQRLDFHRRYRWLLIGWLVWPYIIADWRQPGGPFNPDRKP